MSKRQFANQPEAIVISPSGNFYGSEQVLFDYLNNTRFTYHVFVPGNSVFSEKLKTTTHKISHFKSVRLLYVRVFQLLLTGRYSSVYLNEAGHSNYVHLLAQLFRKTRFVIHVRIMEDTDPLKWRQLRKENTTLITISDYVQQRLEPESIVVRDLFDFPAVVPAREKIGDKRLEVAVIGRISYTKGFNTLVALSHAMEKMQGDKKIVLNIYGDVSDDVKEDINLPALRNSAFIRFHGFVNSKQIYDQNELILHLSKTEPLGRIFFEALSSGRPVVGFNAGGIGEIASLSGLLDFMVELSAVETSAILEKIISVAALPDLKERLERALALMKEKFGVENYVNAVDTLIMKNPV